MKKVLSIVIELCVWVHLIRDKNILSETSENETEYSSGEDVVIDIDERPELYHSLFDEKILDLVKRKGWKGLTDTQLKTAEYVSKGYNIILTAPTGTGKTEAVLLPILSIMLREKACEEKGVALLYITPMRALINDLYKRISWWAEKLGFIVSRKHGDTPTSERIRRLRKIPHILIITPESLEIDLDWSTRFREYYSTLKWVVVDEVHELINTKRGIQLSILLERLRRISGNDFQRIFLSATVGDPEYILRFFQGSSERKRAVVSSNFIKRIRISLEKIESKENTDLLNEVGKKIRELYQPVSIIFVNSRYMAERLHEHLEKIGVDKVYVHHSSISRKLKEEIEDKMRMGDANIVIATKTLELGIDIGHVKKVIQFRSPGQVTSLIQRIGRSGHGLREISHGTIIVDDDIEIIEIASLIDLMLKGFIERETVRGVYRDVIAKTILGMALKNLVDPEEIYLILKSVYLYKDLSYEDFMSIIDYLVKRGVLERYSDNSIRTSGRFFSIWSFDSKSGVKSFSEFFTYINENNLYLVKSNGEFIGALDEFFVYRVLRVGDVIILSGRLWRIIRIDDSQKIIEVNETDNAEGLIPIWYGDIVDRKRETALKFYELIRGGEKSLERLREVVDEKSLSLIKSSVEKVRRWFRENNIEIPNEKNLVIEDLGDEKILLYPFGEKLAELIGYVLLNEAMKKVGKNVGVRINAYAISLIAENIDPVEMLINIVREDRFEQTLRNALYRSPKVRDKIREIQYSLGVTGNGENDEYVLNEAYQQLLSELGGVEALKEFLYRLVAGEIKIRRIRPRTPSVIAQKLSKIPPTRIWLKDLSYMIYKELKGMALTVSELAEILDLPEDMIEGKLKEMRKDDFMPVVQFRDVVSNEIRWALLEDLENIVRDPLFAESFTPLYTEDLIEISYKTDYGGISNKIILRVNDVINNSNVLNNIFDRYEEIYELKISYYGERSSNKSVSYYNVKRKAVKYIILNGITYLQKIDS